MEDRIREALEVLENAETNYDIKHAINTLYVQMVARVNDRDMETREMMHDLIRVFAGEKLGLRVMPNLVTQYIENQIRLGSKIADIHEENLYLDRDINAMLPDGWSYLPSYYENMDTPRRFIITTELAKQSFEESVRRYPDIASEHWTLQPVMHHDLYTVIEQSNRFWEMQLILPWHTSVADTLLALM